MLGTLETVPALTRKDLLATPVFDAIEAMPAERSGQILVAPIDAALADTAAFCEAYQVGLEVSANCVVIAGKREGETRYAACMVLATTRADVNNAVRKLMNVRKASFAPMDEAVAMTGMEYGGITPIGLPPEWPIYVDAAVHAAGTVIIGSGVRHSKIELPATLLSELPNATVVEGLAR